MERKENEDIWKIKRNKLMRKDMKVRKSKQEMNKEGSKEI
jgi:hypothetical protein